MSLIKQSAHQYSQTCLFSPQPVVTLLRHSTQLFQVIDSIKTTQQGHCLQINSLFVRETQMSNKCKSLMKLNANVSCCSVFGNQSLWNAAHIREHVFYFIFQKKMHVEFVKLCLVAVQSKTQKKLSCPLKNAGQLQRQSLNVSFRKTYDDVYTGVCLVV